MGTNSKHRVLMVHNYYQIAGGEDTVVANEKELLEDNGHEVFLYTRSNSELNSFSALKKMLLPFSTVFNVRTYREVKKLIKEKNIDVVHVHNTLNLVSPAVYYAARACRVPVVQTIHNFRLLCPNGVFYRNGHVCEDCTERGLMCAVKHSCYRGSRLQTLACVISTAIHRATRIYGKLNYICLTEFNREKLLGLSQINPDRVFVKANFVDNDGTCTPSDQRKNQMVFAGRIDKLKGVDVLLRAWKRMGSDAPKLIFCGTGPMDEWCREYAEENGLNIDIRGFLPNAEVLKIVSESRAVILPTQWYEGFPMSIAEAFSVGTPVLCSDIGNAGSLITEGVTGHKFRPDSEEELAEAVMKLGDLHMSTMREYQEKYTREKNYQMLLSVYNNAGV